MTDFLCSLTYEHWLLIMFAFGFIVFLVTRILERKNTGVKTATGWRNYKDLFVECGYENARQKKRNETIVSMNNKMVLEIKELHRTIIKLSEEKSELQDRLHLDNDTKSQILS